MDSALSLCTAILVNQILESARSLATVCEPHFVLYFLRAVHVSKRRESDIVKRVVRNVVLAKVRKAVLE